MDTHKLSSYVTDIYRRAPTARPPAGRQLSAFGPKGTLILGLHTGTEAFSVKLVRREAGAGIDDPSITPPVRTVLTPPAYMYRVGVVLGMSTRT